MCGIAGIYGLRKADPEETLRRMLGLMRHRGPDDEGVYRSGGLALGMRRLSIIDLAGGRQPIESEDGGVVAVCNGEIYNFRELASELEKKGHRFRTGSDAEAIVHAYEEYGARALERLRGMFSFCVYDKGRELLFLARDRMGKKPLHYAHSKGFFAFSSEARPLLECVTGEIDRGSLAKYLVYGFVPAPHTMHSGIKKLLPGHSLTYEPRTGRLSIEQYWDLDFTKKDPGGNAVEALEERLCEAVRARLLSDVPLGAFLSGGIDSSLVVAMMAGHRPAGEIKTFSIGFDESAFDESACARAVAERYATDHHEKVFRQSECMGVASEVLGRMDEPISDPSLVPTYLLSRFAREEITVALSGDGGDELFGGYPKYFIHRYARYFDSLPACLRKGLFDKLAAVVPLRPENLFFNYKVLKFIECSGRKAEHKNQLWTSAFMAEELPSIAGIAPDERLLEDVDMWGGLFNGADLVEKMMYLDTKLMLSEMYLVKTDRASMLNSLEVRSPFLDQDVAAFAASIPVAEKVRRTETKRILRRLALKYIPGELVYRRKRGFGLPIARWLRDGLSEEVESAIRDGHCGLIDPGAALALLEAHRSGRADNSGKLWNIYALLKWRQGDA